MLQLYLADNNNLYASDKFAKVRPLFNMLNEKCLRIFIPERNISMLTSLWYLVTEGMDVNSTCKANQSILGINYL